MEITTERIQRLCQFLQQDRDIDEVLIVEAIADAEECLRHHQTTAETLCRLLRDLEKARGRYLESERHARRALDLSNASCGRGQSPNLADLVALASVLIAQGKHEDAEPLIGEALSLVEAGPAPDTGEVAENSHQLATLLMETGRLDEAADFYRRAVAIHRRLGERHNPAFAIALHNLAVLYDAGGRFDEAGDLWQEAKAVLDAGAEDGAGQVGSRYS